MLRHYSYVGPPELAEDAAKGNARFCANTYADLISWLSASVQVETRNWNFTATFIVDLVGRLWLADQHSEHIVCAAGQDVLAAGEITFGGYSGSVVVTAITNQSTGFCPEPESWDSVSKALDSLGIASPSGFTATYTFRRCDVCHSINIVKDEWFECAVCQNPLSLEWNFQ